MFVSEAQLRRLLVAAELVAWRIISAGARGMLPSLHAKLPSNISTLTSSTIHTPRRHQTNYQTLKVVVLKIPGVPHARPQCSTNCSVLFCSTLTQVLPIAAERLRTAKQHVPQWRKVKVSTL